MIISDEEKFVLDDVLSLIDLEKPITNIFKEDSSTKDKNPEQENIHEPEPLPLVVLAIAELSKNIKYSNSIMERSLQQLIRFTNKSNCHKLKYQSVKSLVGLSSFDSNNYFLFLFFIF